MCNEAKKLKKFIMQVPKCGVEPAGWEVTFYNGGSGNQETATTDSWDFTTYANAVFVNPDAAGSVVVKSTAEKTVNDVKMTEYEKDGTYYLSADATQLGAEGNLSLTLSKAGTGKTNTTNKNGAAYSYQEGSTSGLRIKYDAFKIASVKGKVALTIEWYCIQGKDANDRNLELRIGDSGTVESIGNDSTKDASASVKMTNVFKEFDAGTGTNIYIGASNNIFIKSITIAKQAGAFTASTNNTTANDVVTLGLAGISVSSSADTVATAALSDGKVAITSVGAGEAVITVEDANGKKATIAVTVASSGDITLGAITKYARPAPVAGTPTAATSADAKDGSVTLTLDGLSGDLEFSLDETTWVTEATVKTSIATFTVSTSGTTATVSGLPVGTYYVRYAATTAYAASASTSVAISAAAAAGSIQTIKYFDSTLTAFSGAGVSSDSSVVTATEANVTGYTGKFGTVNNVKSHFYETNKKTTWTKDATVFEITLKLTAVKDLKIMSITGDCNESTTGNIKRTLKVGTSDATDLGTGKAITIDKSNINYFVSAGSTVDIVITTIATNNISDKTMKQLFKDLVISVQ